MPHSAQSNPPRSFNISTRLTWGCAEPTCTKVRQLMPCPVCKVVQYCSHEHQFIDRPGHRSLCAKIKKAQASLQKEDKALRRRAGSVVLEEEQDLFRGIEARRYSRARLKLVETLLRSNAAPAILLSVDHLVSMLQLHRADPMGIRDVLPALYIRLGRDQEAYDFCHWWATTGHGDDYDWFDRQAPFLDTKNADIWGEVGVFLGSRFYLPHVVALTLLSIRLVIDLNTVQQARQHIGPHVPREILDTVQQYSIHSSILSVSKIIEQEDQTQRIANLRTQIKKLYTAVQKANRHFWPALIKPGHNLEAQPTSYGQGDQGQMQLVLQYNYNAWAETPGSISIIKELSVFSTEA
jgi:hypothetical protein